MAKSEADKHTSSYKRDAATANDRAREISKKAERKLARAVAYAHLQARRQTFEEASAKGVDLFAEIEKARALEEESAPSTTLDEGSGSDLDSSEGIGEFSEMRPCPLGEEGGSSASGPKNDNKRKESSVGEEIYCEAGSVWRCKGDATVEAFDKLKSKLLRCEARLRKALDGEKSLRLLCDKRARELIHLRYEMNRSQNYKGCLERQFQRKTKDLERLWGRASQAKYECNELKAQIYAQVAGKKNALAKMKVEVVDAWAEAEEIRAKADKKVAVYLKEAADA
ncbi:PREDICTED: uncharacterized protein LOC109237939 [Nicotiana attenuata]|uniref:uncharacterized protein LOC109237939 n=1 Tax=Nicotiana attenuata TaxID=49451 RepID=UPI0009056F65|nr:PREDICTED: uncharacterized protein LOC109237939 [Nicotiana attenuata]